jgi:hypothetical protein
MHENTSNDAACSAYGTDVHDEQLGVLSKAVGWNIMQASCWCILCIAFVHSRETASGRQA